jgi:hypothetical protein
MIFVELLQKVKPYNLLLIFLDDNSNFKAMISSKDKEFKRANTSSLYLLLRTLYKFL